MLFLSIVQACRNDADTTSNSSATDLCDDYGVIQIVPADAVVGLPIESELYPSAACADVCPLDYEVPAIACGPADGTSSGGQVDSGSGSGSSTAAERGSSESADAATVSILCKYSSECIPGRTSAELRSDGRRDDASPRAGWFAAMAHAEAASIATFLRLERALAAHGAPAELCAACRDAARDEARHARAMRRWSRRQGIEPVRPRHDAAIVPTLEALAIENAVEGCVRESWAALEATWQAHALDDELAQDMAAIAMDEARHAELAWAIDRWARSRLSGAAQARIDVAQACAVAELLTALDRRWSDRTHDRASLGLPGAADAARLAIALRRALWSADRVPSWV